MRRLLLKLLKNILLDPLVTHLRLRPQHLASDFARVHRPSDEPVHLHLLGNWVLELL